MNPKRLPVVLGRMWSAARQPGVVVSFIGIVGFIIDMWVKPVSNAGLILLLAASCPWLLKLVKRLKVGDYLELEPLTPAEIEQKLDTEAAELVQEATPKRAETGEIATAKKPTRTPAKAKAAPKPTIDLIGQTRRHLYLTDQLVLDRLEAEFGVEFRRNVRLGAFELDAVAMTKPIPTLIEIKVVRSSTHIQRRLREAIDHLRTARHEWRRASGEAPRSLLVVAPLMAAHDPDYPMLQTLVSNMSQSSLYDIEIKLVSALDLGSAAGVSLDGQP